MKYLSKKVLMISVVALLCISIGTGAYANSLLTKISAYQNEGITIKVDNKKLNLVNDEGGSLAPIVYEGYSYVPTRYVAEALGATVKWDDDTETINITSGANGNAGKPVNDTSSPAATPKQATPTATPKPSTPTATSKPAGSSSSNKGSVTDPVSLGSSFTYVDLYNYKEGELNSTSAKYSFAINKVTPISASDIEALGFRKPENNTLLEYVLLDVSLKVSDATFKKGSDKDEREDTYLSSYTPDVWGIRNADGNSIIGGTDYGFDGSLDRNISDILSDFPKVGPGDSKSYEASGKILISLYKGQDNLLALQKQDTNLEYDDSFIYFKLQ